MPEQMRPASKHKAPDPANSYERTDPKKESGQGRLDNNTNATPTPRPDHIPATVANAQPPDKHLTSEEPAGAAPKPPANESLGWEKPKKPH